MTEPEKRELDAWIAENVMKWKRTENPDEHTDHMDNLFWHRPAGSCREAVLVGNAYELWSDTGKYSHSWHFFEPTTCLTDAVKIFKRCIKKTTKIEVSQDSTGDYWVEGCFAETLEEAICLFAKQLFTEKPA